MGVLGVLNMSLLLLGLYSLICAQGCLWFPEMYSASQHLNILEFYKDCSTESMTQGHGNHYEEQNQDV